MTGATATRVDLQVEAGSRRWRVQGNYPVDESPEVRTPDFINEGLALSVRQTDPHGAQPK